MCVDGSLMKEFILDDPVSQTFLAFLEHLGTVSRREHLRKPYFVFEKADFISIKGFVGDTSVEVRYASGFQDLTKDYFHLILFYERDHEKGVQKLKEIEESIAEKIAVRKR